jgi:hypothetical protein
MNAFERLRPPTVVLVIIFIEAQLLTNTLINIRPSLPLLSVTRNSSVCWMLPDVEERLKDPERHSALLRVARLLEAEPSVLGCSAHLLAVGRRPTAAGAPTA